MNNKIDLDSVQTKHSGLKGWLESSLRKFKLIMHISLLIPTYFVASLCLGISITPAIYLFQWVSDLTATSTSLIQNLSLGVSLAFGYFLYGFTLVFVAAAFNFLIQGYLKPFKGPYYSVESIKWYLHNGLTYLVRFTFLEFATPTPLSLLFYRMMGMKMGRGVVLNSTWISDPSLIELGDKVTIGGSVTIVAHYGVGGLLVIAPVQIQKNATIGLKATIMGGVTIGEGAKILPNSVVLPKTVVPAGETWAGVPAQKINLRKVA